MASGGGGGDGEVVPVSPLAEQPAAKKSRAAGRKHHQAQAAACLPLDIIVEEIATRSDAATLVRCAATCRDARRRIAEDPTLRGRLRLRDTGRFLLPLLRGHLVGIGTYDGDLIDVYLVDTSAADATRLVKANFAEEDETLSNVVPLDSRGGLVLVRATSSTTAHPWMWHQQLLVCNPATRRRLALPLPPITSVSYYPEQYVLLVGDGYDGEVGAGAGAGATVGRPFKLLKTRPVWSNGNHRLMVQTFSSEHGAWSPVTEIPTPNIHGRCICSVSLEKVLVVGDVVHWLWLTDVRSYVLALHATAAQVNATALPASFPRDEERNPRERHRYQYLLAAASAGGNPVVLVADKDKITAWEQSKHTEMWQPQVVMETKAITLAKHVPDLVCFAERSGVVLLQIHGRRLLWLDLHSKKIVRSYEFMSYPKVYCPYEMDSSSWLPTFSSAGNFLFIYRQIGQLNLRFQFICLGFVERELFILEFGRRLWR